MSWSERISRRALLAAVLPLAAGGCFRPMLAETGEASELRGRIALPGVSGRDGYYLRRQLEERLGTPRETAYRLEVELQVRERGLAIAQDSAVTRRSVTARAPWRLYRQGEEAPVLTGEELVQAGYNQTADLYATRSAQRDVERRVVAEVGERIARAILGQARTVQVAS